MSFTSYAQNFEDVMLWRALKHVENGFYIDVGANNPNHDSVTRTFYENGWRGINIEPVSQWYEMLKKVRPRDINLQVVVGETNDETLLYEIPGTGLSTINKEIAERHEAEAGFKYNEVLVKSKCLTEICKQYHTEPIHFLKIDVEGAEKNVLESIDFSIIRPWIVLVESTLPNTQIEKYKDWQPILDSADYKFVYFDGLNRYYIADEHKELKKHFKLPPNYFDGFTFDMSHYFTRGVARQYECVINELSQEKENNQWLKKEWGDSKNQNQYLQNQLAINKGRIEELVGELAITNSNLDDLRTRFEENTRNLINTKTKLKEQSEINERLKKEWESAKEIIDDLKGVSNHWWAVADNLSQELNAVYHSKSWRITSPFRKLLRLLKWLSRLPISVVQYTMAFPPKLIRWLLIKCMKLVQKIPVLKGLLVTLLGKYPDIDNKLRGLASRGGLVVAQSINSETYCAYAVNMPATKHLAEENQITTPITDVTELTSEGKRIYRKLNLALIKNKQEKPNAARN